jgi:hypothetical protein
MTSGCCWVKIRTVFECPLSCIWLRLLLFQHIRASLIYSLFSLRGWCRHGCSGHPSASCAKSENKLIIRRNNIQMLSMRGYLQFSHLWAFEGYWDWRRVRPSWQQNCWNPIYWTKMLMISNIYYNWLPLKSVVIFTFFHISFGPHSAYIFCIFLVSRLVSPLRERLNSRINYQNWNSIWVLFSQRTSINTVGRQQRLQYTVAGRKPQHHTMAAPGTNLPEASHVCHRQ